MNPKLSVVIPIYKVEDYLERCVKSVLNQDYRDLEVILVDDGSPDRCPQICDELAKTDDRIVVIHKPNGGLSSARNAGIEVAKGEYLAFLDSDDQWAENKLGVVMSKLMGNNVDMLVFDSVDLFPDGSVRKRDDGDFFEQEFTILNTIDYYKKIMSVSNFMESACTKILPSGFVREYDLTFSQGITSEDSEWMLRVLKHADKIAVSNVELFICTCLRAGSIQNSIKPKNIRDLIGIIDKSVAYYKDHADNGIMQYEMEQCAYLLANATGQLVYINDEDEKKNLINELKMRAFLFQYAKNRKTRMAQVVYSLFGYNILTKFLEIYMILMKKNLVSRKKERNG